MEVLLWSVVEKRVRKWRFGPSKTPNFSPRPNHGGPRGVQSEGSEAKGKKCITTNGQGKKCYTPKWGPEGSGGGSGPKPTEDTGSGDSGWG